MSEKGWVTRLAGKNKVEIVEKPLPEVKEDGMLVEIGLAGICGTDIHIMENADRPEWSGGLPFTLGHEICGRVAKMGRKAQESLFCDEKLSEGDRIAFYAFLPCGNCWWERRLGPDHNLLCTQPKPGYFMNPDSWPHFTSGWGEYLYIQPGSWVWKAPAGMSYEELVLTEPFSMGIRAVAKATALPAWKNLDMLSFGGTAAVLGAGAIGVLTAVAAKIAGAGLVVLVGGPRKNLEIAKQIGAADVFIDIDATSPAERIEQVRKLSEGGVGVDVVFEGAGVPSAFLEGLDMVRKEGTYVELGCLIDDGRKVSLNVSQHIVQKDLTLYGVTNQPAHDFTKALACMRHFKNRFAFPKVVTDVFPLREYEKAIAKAKDPREKGIKIALTGKGYGR
jgi:threonine dehydrogenase-like Zn-dependent dehydrogenase